MPLTLTDEESINQTTKAHPRNRFSFYDHFHSRGFHIDQDETAIAIVTFSLDLDLTTFLQGILRMRKFFGHQEIIILLIEDELAAIRSKIGLNEGVILGPRHIIDLAYLAQNSMINIENQTVLLHKMRSKLEYHVINCEIPKNYFHFVNLHKNEIKTMNISLKDKIENFFELHKTFLAENYELFREFNQLKEYWFSKIIASKIDVEIGATKMARIIEKQA